MIDRAVSLGFSSALGDEAVEYVFEATLTSDARGLIGVTGREC